jgi:hypothetical protein
MKIQPLFELLCSVIKIVAANPKSVFAIENGLNVFV